MDKTNCLTYVSTNERTYINADGKEVCSLTKCSLVDTDRVVYAFSYATGVSVEESKKTLESYPTFKEEDILKKEPSECLHFKSGTNPETGEARITTLLVRINIEDHLDEIKAKLQLTDT